MHRPRFTHPPAPRPNMDITGRVPGGLYSAGMGVPICRRFCLAEPFALDEGLAFQRAFEHPRRIVYRIPAAARAVAMALERPGLTICGLSALSVFGLNFFADANDTTFYGNVSRKIPATQVSPLVLRRPPGPRWKVFYLDHALDVSPPAVALVESLRLIRNGTYSWEVPAIEGFIPLELRAISLIDATRRHLSVPIPAILEAGKGRVNNRWLRRMCDLSSELADSPKETEMRLICQRSLAGTSLELSEQVPLTEGSRIITVFDLALTDVKIGIMYDGEHHLSRKQRDKDAAINLESTLQGWVVVRVTAGTLRRLPEVLDRLVQYRITAAR